MVQKILTSHAGAERMCNLAFSCGTYGVFKCRLTGTYEVTQRLAFVAAHSLT